MATSGELAARFSVTDQTIRTWATEFSTWLSDGARGGQVRYFNDEDEQILATVASLRQQQRNYAEIRELLASGYRVEVAAAPEPGETGTGLSLPQMTALIGQQQGTIETLREERDHLREELRGERTARLEALERAARAEAKLEAREEHRSPQRPTERQNRPWWKLWN
jgi:DNA-binding transcriptional MerR regulator